MNIKFKQQLKDTILLNSVSKDFEEATQEWFLSHIQYSERLTNKCICGKLYIKKLCYVKNKINNNVLLLGSTCIEKFMSHIKVKFYFNGLEQLKTFGVPNPVFLDYLFNKKIINQYTFNFYNGMYNKKRYTQKQQDFKSRMNINTLQNIYAYNRGRY